MTQIRNGLGSFDSVGIPHVKCKGPLRRPASHPDGCHPITNSMQDARPHTKGAKPVTELPRPPAMRAPQPVSRVEPGEPVSHTFRSMREYHVYHTHTAHHAQHSKSHHNETGDTFSELHCTQNTIKTKKFISRFNFVPNAIEFA